MNKEKLIDFYTELLRLKKTNYMCARVISDSMWPLIKEGDLIKFLYPEREIVVGDIIIYRKMSERLTVHRVVEIVNLEDQKYFRTKGDANLYPDKYIVFQSEVVGIFECILCKGQMFPLAH